MNKRHLIIATRESQLALYQAEWVKKQLMAHHPHLTIDLLGITTQADKRLDVLLTQIGGKGLFVKELEEALLEGRADMAVHSMKDVPMELPQGLCLPVICEREDVRDVLVSNHYSSFADLPKGAIVGTSSLRRQTQLMTLRGDLTLKPLRGNIHTRLNKLDQQDFDALILASAGLKRLDETARIRDYFPIESMLPAAGQGALGIECREDDEDILTLIQVLQHEASYLAVQAERALCRFLEAGCHTPVAAYAQIQSTELHLKGLVANKDGSYIIQAQHAGLATQAEKIGQTVAQDLIKQGVNKILSEFT